MKINKLSPSEKKQVIKTKIISVLRDYGQVIKIEDINYMVDRVNDIITSYDLTVDEFLSTLDIGVVGGFGKFKKLTVQAIAEWLKTRSFEISNKRLYEENRSKNDRNLNIFKNSALGQVCNLKFKLFSQGKISEQVYESNSLKQLFALFSYTDNNGCLKFSKIEAMEFLLDSEKDYQLQKEMEAF